MIVHPERAYIHTIYFYKNLLTTDLIFRPIRFSDLVFCRKEVVGRDVSCRHSHAITFATRGRDYL